MKNDLQKRFNDIAEKNPSLSSFLCFADLVREKGYGQQVIVRNFRKLVDPEDWKHAATEDQMIEHFILLSKKPMVKPSEKVEMPQESRKSKR